MPKASASRFTCDGEWFFQRRPINMRFLLKYKCRWTPRPRTTPQPIPSEFGWILMSLWATSSGSGPGTKSLCHSSCSTIDMSYAIRKMSTRYFGFIWIERSYSHMLSPVGRFVEPSYSIARCRVIVKEIHVCSSGRSIFQYVADLRPNLGDDPMIFMSRMR